MNPSCERLGRWCITKSFHSTATCLLPHLLRKRPNCVCVWISAGIAACTTRVRAIVASRSSFSLWRIRCTAPSACGRPSHPPAYWVLTTLSAASCARLPIPPPCPRWLYGYKPLARDHPPLPLSHSPSTGGTCSGRRLIRVRKTAFPTSMFAAPCSKCTHRMDSSGLCTCWECSAGSLRPCSAGTFAPSVKSSNRALRCTFKRENRLRVKSVSGLTLRLSHAQVRDAFVVPHVPRLGALGRVRARRGAQSWTGRHAVAGSRRHCKRCVMRLAAKRSRRSQGRSWVFVTHR